MKSNSIRFLVVLLLLGAPNGLTSFFQARAQNPASVVGNWTLTTVSDRAGRRIKFEIRNGRLEGAYYTSGNIEKPISEARFSRGYLSFKVPTLRLYFEVRLVRDRFEGKMIAYGTNKKTPERVQMSRR